MTIIAPRTAGESGGGLDRPWVAHEALSAASAGSLVVSTVGSDWTDGELARCVTGIPRRARNACIVATF